MVEVTSSVLVSMTETTASPSLLAYTQRPSGVTTMPCGPVAIGMVFITLLVRVSKTATALSLNRAIYALGLTVCAAAGEKVARLARRLSAIARNRLNVMPSHKPVALDWIAAAGVRVWASLISQRRAAASRS